MAPISDKGSTLHALSSWTRGNENAVYGRKVLCRITTDASAGSEVNELSLGHTVEVASSKANTRMTTNKAARQLEVLMLLWDTARRPAGHHSACLART